MQSKDRRRKKRFPLALTVHYSTSPSLKMATFSGTGQIANISSSGILFRCTDVLDVGSTIALAVDWPAAASNDPKRRLAILGRVIRTGSATAVRISQHWFETVAGLDETQAGKASDAGLEPETVSPVPSS